MSRRKDRGPPNRPMPMLGSANSPIRVGASWDSSTVAGGGAPRISGAELPEGTIEARQVGGLGDLARTFGSLGRFTFARLAPFRISSPGIAREAPVAGVIVSEDAPSGDAPDGTFWAKTGAITDPVINLDDLQDVVLTGAAADHILQRDNLGVWRNVAPDGVFAPAAHTHKASEIGGASNAERTFGSTARFTFTRLNRFQVSEPGITAEPGVAAVIVSADEPTGDAPDGTLWAKTGAGGGGSIGPHILGEHQDATFSVPAEGHFIRRNGADLWVNTLLGAGDIPNLDAAKIASGELGAARVPALSALNGNIAYSQLPSGSGTWSGSPTIAGNVTARLTGGGSFIARGNQATNGDPIGALRFFQEATSGFVAEILAVRHNSNFSAHLTFLTRSGSSTTERMRVRSQGEVLMGTTATGTFVKPGGIRATGDSAFDSGVQIGGDLSIGQSGDGGSRNLDFLRNLTGGTAVGAVIRVNAGGAMKWLMQLRRDVVEFSVPITLGTSSPGSATAGGIRATGQSQFDGEVTIGGVRSGKVIVSTSNPSGSAPDGTLWCKV